MAKYITALNPGDKVRVKYHGSKRLGNEPSEENMVFVDIKGTGDDRRAIFQYADFPAGGSQNVELYRYNGHWAYGMSAEKASLV
jgi:hypothetical protein